ncbi:RING finger protein 32-like isoform X1 [Styela clava]
MSYKRRDHLPSSAALTAGAFQDHLLHDLSIGDLSLSNPLKSYSGLKQKLRTDEKKRRKALQNVKPTVDTGRMRRPVNQKQQENDGEREYVLDPIPKPSLAQKLGLVSQPDQPLTNEEWSSIKQRSIAREDFKNPCAICQEYFAISDQVLLSCSHVFHKACIQAFERFTGKKTCPMCRKIQYQARVVHDGTRVYKEKAAISIQSYWRGYVVRKWYYKLRRTVPPRDKKLRQRFYEDKLQEITDRMVAMTSTETVDRFLQDIDNSIASSRAIFQHFEDSCLHRLSDEDWINIEVKAFERNDTDCPICLRALRYRKNDATDKKTENNSPQASSSTSNYKNRSTSSKSSRSDQQKQKSSQQNSKATKVDTKPIPRNTKPLNSSSDFNQSEHRSLQSSSKSPKEVFLSLLSCSHVFHAKCLEALEEFYIMENMDGTKNYGSSPTMQQGLDFKCPVCRALYVKHILN